MRRPRLGHGEPDHQLQHVAAQCGRADCARPASARLMLDITNRVVSIDLAIGEVGAGMLCFSHAERIVVPRGWTLVDNRTLRPPLFDGERYEVPAPPAPLPAVEVAKPLAPLRRERKRRSPFPGADSTESGDAMSEQPQGAADQFDLRDGPVGTGIESHNIEIDNDNDNDNHNDNTEVVVDVTVESSVDASDDTYPDQLQIRPYELPAGYRDVAMVDIDEPDRAASPLLARAFDMTRHKRRS